MLYFFCETFVELEGSVRSTAKLWPRNRRETLSRREREDDKDERGQSSLFFERENIREHQRTLEKIERTMTKKRKLNQHNERPPSKRSCQVETHHLKTLEQKLVSTTFSRQISLESRLDKGLNGIFCDISGTNDIMPVIQLIDKISNQGNPVLILTSEKRKTNWYLGIRSRLQSSSFLTVPYWGKSSRDRSELRNRLLNNKKLMRVPVFVSSFEIWTQDEHLLCQSEWNVVVFDSTETNKDISNIMKHLFSGRIILPTKHAVLMTNVSPDKMAFEMLWSMVRFSIPFWTGKRLDNIVDEETEKTLRIDSRDVMSYWKDVGSLENKWRNVLSHLIVTRSAHDVNLVEVSFELSAVQKMLLERLQRDISVRMVFEHKARFFQSHHDLTLTNAQTQIPIHELLATWRKVCMMNGSFDEKEDILSEEPTLNLLSMRKIREILDIVRKVSTHPDLYVKDNVKMPLYLGDLNLLRVPYLIQDEIMDDTKIVPMRRSMLGPYVVFEYRLSFSNTVHTQNYRYIVPERVFIADHHYSMMPKECFASRLLAMFPIDVFMTLQRKYLRLTMSSSFCSDLVDLPTSLELLRSIYMNRTWY